MLIGCARIPTRTRVSISKEWAFVLPCLLLCREDSSQRKHPLRTAFHAVRYVARTSGQ